MKHLKVKNFGPIKSADICLRKVNLIIGMQSSGKSCLMMVLCFCSWVEKRIALRQSAEEFEKEGSFIRTLERYYHCNGYVHPDTYIEYSTKYMEFSYDHSSGNFILRWGKKHWSYRRPKVSYIPAERNMLSLVSNWNKLETSYDSILDFKADWDTARMFMGREEDILGTGITYEFDNTKGADYIITPDGKPLGLTNSSSGIQSLIPQYVHLDYLFTGIYSAEKQAKEKTFSEKQLTNNLLEILYQRNFRELSEEVPIISIAHIEGRDYVFNNSEQAQKFRKEANALLYTHHAEVFLEEPESNLFPPTQHQLAAWLVDKIEENAYRDFFFIASHSPYLLNYLLQEKLRNFALFLTYPISEGYYGVKTASDEDIQDIYDNGSDAFFNFEAFYAQ